MCQGYESTWFQYSSDIFSPLFKSCNECCNLVLSLTELDFFTAVKYNFHSNSLVSKSHFLVKLSKVYEFTQVNSRSNQI